MLLLLSSTRQCYFPPQEKTASSTGKIHLPRRKSIIQALKYIIQGLVFKIQSLKYKIQDLVFRIRVGVKNFMCGSLQL